MTTHKTLDEERRRQHEQNSRKLNTILALLIAIASYIAIILSVSHPLKTELDPHKAFHSMQTEPQIAEMHKYVATE